MGYNTMACSCLVHWHWCLYSLSGSRSHSLYKLGHWWPTYNKLHALNFLISCGGVRLSPLGTSATNWPTVPVKDDRWVWSIWWNENWQGKPKYLEKTRPSATLSTTNPTWPDLGSNPGSRSGKPVTNRMSYGMASSTFTRKTISKRHHFSYK
jgi:hypothetical protein